ncbi:hypothetical protein [Streptomyces niveus]
MRVRVSISTVLGLTAALTLTACSPSGTEVRPAAGSSASTDTPAENDHDDSVLSSPELASRLLGESDLGDGYTRKPERPSGGDDDITVLGCPALEELGSDAATGSGGLDFPHRAKAAFTYTGNGEVTEELYSGAGSKLSDGTGRIFDAMTGCPAYQVLAGSTPIDITTQEVPAPRLGDERWSHLLTFSSEGADMVVKQTAIRDGSVLLIVSGSPALVDRHLDTALTKATAG